MRVGIAHHFGWAVAVTASSEYQVADRRRIELIEPGVPTAPFHHEGKPLSDAATSELVAHVRASAARATSAALDELASALHEPIVSVSLRAWPHDFPEDTAVQRRVPYESRADSEGPSHGARGNGRGRATSCRAGRPGGRGAYLIQQHASVFGFLAA
jgi:hypothetical protein